MVQQCVARVGTSRRCIALLGMIRVERRAAWWVPSGIRRRVEGALWAEFGGRVLAGRVACGRASREAKEVRPEGSAQPRSDDAKAVQENASVRGSDALPLCGAALGAGRRGPSGAKLGVLTTARQRRPWPTSKQLPAASSPNTLRPSALSRWPSSSAASTPLRPTLPDSPRPGTWAIIRRPGRSETELRFNPRYHHGAV
jgi:hypothetical protein